MPDNTSPCAAVFVHIPKAAGSTLMTVLQREYGRDHVFLTYHIEEKQESGIAALSIEAQQPYRAYAGHFPYGVHTYLTQSPCYFTVLRHPLKRLISLYHYIQRTPTHYLYEATQALSLEAFLTSGSTTELDNGQVRQLVGLHGENLKSIQEVDYQQAQQNLAQNFAVFGIQERFDETLLLLHHRLGWQKYPLYVSQKVAPKRANKPLAPDIDTQVRERNRYDFALYDWAVQAFDQQLKAALSNLATELQRYQQVNRRYSAWMRRYQQVNKSYHRWKGRVYRWMKRS